MLYREIIVVCFEIHTKHINALCGQNVECLNVKPGVTYCNHSDLMGYGVSQYGDTVPIYRKHFNHWMQFELI
jgi:hypothetical protein